MMKHVHRQHTAQGTETSGGQEQRPLRDPAFPLPGTLLIIPHQEKAEQIRYQNNTDHNNQFQVQSRSLLFHESRRQRSPCATHNSTTSCILSSNIHEYPVVIITDNL